MILQRGLTISLALCFRPLAGFWFLNIENVVKSRRANVGFRPLAGFWFLNKKQEKGIIAFAISFPSPCGVLVLK